MTVTITRDHDVAIIGIDNPPVNAGTRSQRADLHEALVEASSLSDVQGIVISSAGRHFYAGSDLKEFDGPLARPTLPEVIDAVEQSPVPVVAAVRGLALGGGLELALACDRRFADPSAQLGFPEVTFGMLPGAGGTVRAGRLLGVPAAIDLVTSARRVNAAEALSIGLVDAVTDPDRLLTQAIETARALDGRDLPRNRAAVTPDPEAVATARSAIARRARPNVVRAADMVERGASMDVDDALRLERELFDTLRLSREAQNLRYVFFAAGAAAKDLRTAAEPVTVRSVGVVGAGTMGAGLARAFAAHGYDVTVVDSSAEALTRVTTSAPDVATAQSVDALAECDLVVDAVFEDMTVKQSLLTDLEKVLRPDAIIATNTSYLDVDEMSGVLEHPERFGGLHFFNPPDRNKLAEVIPATATEESTSATLAAVAKRLGKTVIKAGRGDGFVANRVYAEYRAQAEFLVQEGASPADVDEAMVGLGMAIGPFAVADMSGLDIAWARRKRLAATGNPRERYVAIADRLCEAGRLGRKTSAGWYDYPEGARRGVPSPAVAELIDQDRLTSGFAPVQLDAPTITRRILASMLAAAIEVLDHGIASRASDIDVAMVEGFAFPRHLGGPLRELSHLDPQELLAALQDVHTSDPVRYASYEPATRGEVPAAVARALAEVAHRSTNQTTDFQGATR